MYVRYVFCIGKFNEWFYNITYLGKAGNSFESNLYAGKGAVGGLLLSQIGPLIEGRLCFWNGLLGHMMIFHALDGIKR